MEMWERLCDICKHRHFGKTPATTCDAYPVRIPLEIRLMRVDHHLPYKGDHGVLFEPKDDGEETRRRLAKVKVRRPKRLGENDLDRRVHAVLDLIPFKDWQNRAKFLCSLRRVARFEELHPAAQELILDAERSEAEP